MLWQSFFHPYRNKINTLRPRQNDQHLPDAVLKCIFLMKLFEFPFKFLWNVFPRVKLAIFKHCMVQMMAWHRPGDKALSEPMTVSLQTHICVTRPQWVKKIWCIGDDSRKKISVSSISKCLHSFNFDIVMPIMKCIVLTFFRLLGRLLGIFGVIFKLTTWISC